MKEAYCSYEISKLLKEKGFDEPIRCWYDDEQDFHEKGVRMSNTDCLPPTIMCPTHQMAMRWLREVHNIDIIIFHEKLPNDCHYYPIVDKYGNCYGSNSPSIDQIVDKINEIIDTINQKEEQQ